MRKHVQSRPLLPPLQLYRRLRLYLQNLFLLLVKELKYLQDLELMQEFQVLNLRQNPSLSMDYLLQQQQKQAKQVFLLFYHPQQKFNQQTLQIFLNLNPYLFFSMLKRISAKAIQCFWIYCNIHNSWFTTFYCSINSFTNF